MKFLKADVHKNCKVLAVVDDADNVLTVAAFTSEQDAEAAEDFAYTLLANSGLIKAPADIMTRTTAEELLNIVSATYGATYGACNIFTKDLN